jgi:hypothetical protein
VIERLARAVRRAAPTILQAAIVASAVGVVVAVAGALAGRIVLWPVVPLGLLLAVLSVERRPPE